MLIKLIEAGNFHWQKAEQELFVIYSYMVSFCNQMDSVYIERHTYRDHSVAVTASLLIMYHYEFFKYCGILLFGLNIR